MIPKAKKTKTQLELASRGHRPHCTTGAIMRKHEKRKKIVHKFGVDERVLIITNTHTYDANNIIGKIVSIVEDQSHPMYIIEYRFDNKIYQKPISEIFIEQPSKSRLLIFIKRYKEFIKELKTVKDNL